MDAALYLRISSDPTEQRAGVGRQLEDCEAEANRRGWRVAETIEDNDLSAFGAKLRPGYQRLLTLIRAGQIGAVIAWQGDRLHRDLTEYLEFEKLVRQHRVQVALVRGGDWQVDSAAGRISNRLMAVVNQAESEIKAERVKRAVLARAQKGLPAHTRFRPYGFEADGITVREAEAQLIRAGVADLIAGRRSLTKVAKSWGKSVTGARRLLENRRLIGQREAQGQVFDAQWPAIIDPADFELVQVILAGTSRPARPRRHLLSGLVRCGSCGALLKTTNSRGEVAYRCGAEGCPRKVSRRAGRLEQYVFIETIKHLARVRPNPHAEADAGEAAAEVVRLRQRLAEIEEQLSDAAAGSSVARLERAAQRVEAQIDEALGRIVLTPVVGLEIPGTGLTRPAWMQWWYDATFAERRALLADTLVAVRILPTGRGRLPLDKDAIELVWR